MFICRNYLFLEVGRVRFMFIQIIRSDWLPESLFLIIFAPNDCSFPLFSFPCFFLIQKPKRSTKCSVIGVKDLKTMFSVVNLAADRIPEKNITCTVFWGPQFASLQVLALILQMNIHVGKRRKIKPFENIFLHAMPHYTYLTTLINNHLTPMSD